MDNTISLTSEMKSKNDNPNSMSHEVTLKTAIVNIIFVNTKTSQKERVYYTMLIQAVYSKANSKGMNPNSIFPHNNVYAYAKL